MKKESRSLEDELYCIGMIVLLIGAVGGFLYFKLILPRTPSLLCILYEFLGLYCPGCGGTRAVTALFHGKLLESLWYHPIVLYGVIIYGGFLLSHTLERLKICKIKGWRFHPWHLTAAVMILVLNFLGKNVLLVGFHITLDGAILR